MEYYAAGSLAETLDCRTAEFARNEDVALEKLRKCGLEGMSWFLSDLLHEPNTCVLSSE